MMAYLNVIIPLPNVTAQDIDHAYIRDRSRTAGGRLRQDVAAGRKRAYKLECKYITYDEYTAIMAALDAVAGGPIPLWIDEFGGAPATDSVDFMIDVTGDKRVSFGRAGVWHDNGRHLSLTAEEV